MFDQKKTYESGISFYSLELENYFVDYIPGSIDCLVITFENADQPKRPRLDGTREPWGANFLTRKGYSILGIKPKRVDWYRGPDLHEFFRSQSFKIFTYGFKQVVLYGSSMGGFAALAFAEACVEATVIALNPQSTLSPHLAPWDTRYPEGSVQDWTGDFVDAQRGATCARRVYVAYDPLFDLDRKHIDRLTGANLVSLKMPLVGHVVISWMAEAGILANFVYEALSGSLDEDRCRELARQRRNSVRYYIGMGLRTKSPYVALRCVARILALGLTPYHVNDFVNVVIRHQLWKHLDKEGWRGQLINVDDGLLFIILKTVSDRGFADQALAICHLVMDIRSVNWQILVLAAECQHRLGHLSDGKALAHKAINANPSIGNCYRILARILHDMDDMLGAVVAGEKGVAIEPGSLLGWMDLAKYYGKSGEFQLALKCLRRSQSLDPQNSLISKRIEFLTSHLAANV